MFNWLAARTALGLPRWAFVLIAIALIAFGIVHALATIGGTIAENQTKQQQAGAASQRAQDLQTTLERTEQANVARTEIRDPDGRARYDQCLRSARTPANCQRFVPE